MKQRIPFREVRQRLVERLGRDGLQFLGQPVGERQQVLASRELVLAEDPPQGLNLHLDEKLQKLNKQLINLKKESSVREMDQRLSSIGRKIFNCENHMLRVNVVLP